MRNHETTRDLRNSFHQTHSAPNCWERPRASMVRFQIAQVNKIRFEPLWIAFLDLQNKPSPGHACLSILILAQLN